MDALLSPNRKLQRDLGAEGAVVQLAVYDSRQGGPDGDPASQVLAYYPSDLPLAHQAGALGLVRAVITFSEIFSETSDDIILDAQQHRWVAIAPKAHFGIFTVVNAAWLGKHARDDALKFVLHRVHAAICLLHGSLQALVSRGSTAARRSLTAILNHFGGEMKQGFRHLPNPRNCLAAEAGVHYFALSRPSFTGLQALCDDLLLLPLLPSRAAPGCPAPRDGADGSAVPPPPSRPQSGGSSCRRAVLGCVVMHGGSCLWSDVGRDDTTALVGLAAGSLLPIMRSQQSTWKKLKGAALVTAGRSPQPKARKSVGVPFGRNAWTAASHGLWQLSGTQRSSSSGSDQLLHLPLVHIKGDRCVDTGTPGQVAQLLPVQQGGSLLLLLLMHEDWQPSPLAQSAVAATAGASPRELHDRIDAEVAAEKGGHVKGFRYVFEDGLLGGVADSPPSKVSTLSRDSAVAATAVQRQLDEQLPHLSANASVEDMEVLVKATDSDCWVSGQVAGPRRLVLVMEGRAEKGLLEASTTANHFAANHTSGIF